MRILSTAICLVSISIALGCGSSTPSAESADSHADGSCDESCKCEACKKGKAGETTWCDSCKLGYKDGKIIKCKTCYQHASEGGDPCPDHGATDPI